MESIYIHPNTYEIKLEKEWKALWLEITRSIQRGEIQGKQESFKEFMNNLVEVVKL